MIRDERSACPGCGDRSNLPDGQSLVPGNTAARWQHTPWGRILIGLLLAQGIFYGLRHFVTGLQLAVHLQPEASEESAAFWGIVVLQILQAMALLAGGILAGSGQRNGVALGAVVGVWNGVLSGLTPQAIGQPFSLVGLYGDPLLQMALGALAGWIGSTIWKPLPVEQPRDAHPVARKAQTRPRAPLFAGKVAPIRVCFGAMFGVCGSLGATGLFQLVEKIGDSNQQPMSTTLDLLVTWEIKALALLAGGIVAGANTQNGLKQGLFVGIVTALILAGVQPRIAERWLEVTVLLFISSLCFCLVGGWFGGQLFPPLAPYRRRYGAEPTA
jgi:hypothetical protein